MPRGRRQRLDTNSGPKDYRHETARRKNNPPAGIAPTYEVRERQTTRYQYDPNLDSQLVYGSKAKHCLV